MTIYLLLCNVFQCFLASDKFCRKPLFIKHQIVELLGMNWGQGPKAWPARSPFALSSLLLLSLKLHSNTCSAIMNLVLLNCALLKWAQCWTLLVGYWRGIEGGKSSSCWFQQLCHSSAVDSPPAAAHLSPVLSPACPVTVALFSWHPSELSTTQWAVTMPFSVRHHIQL